eukprot:912862-Rhodomonas_salina.1
MPHGNSDTSGSDSPDLERNSTLLTSLCTTSMSQQPPGAPGQASPRFHSTLSTISSDDGPFSTGTAVTSWLVGTGGVNIAVVVVVIRALVHIVALQAGTLVAV